MTQNIATLAISLADAREKYAELKAVLDAHRTEWEATWAELIDFVDDAKNDVAHLESEIRTAGLAHYAANPDSKKLPHSLGIREVTRLEYDPAAALDWAMDKRMYLKLDTSAFEKVAKVTPVEFVTTITTTTVTIPTDGAKLRKE